MREVARATIEGKEYAKDSEGKNIIKIQQLLPFEPYHNVGDFVLEVLQWRHICCSHTRRVNTISREMP